MAAIAAFIVGIILVIILIWGFSVIKTIIPSENGIMNEILFEIVGSIWIGIIVGIIFLISGYSKHREKSKKPPGKNLSRPNT